MKLWLLRPIDGAKPWEPWYDKAFGFVIRAETEAEARAMAQKEGCDEIRDGCPAWTDHNLSTCVALNIDGPAEIIIEDVHAA